MTAEESELEQLRVDDAVSGFALEPLEVEGLVRRG